MAKKFGLIEAKRATAFARSRGRKLTPEVVFGVEVGIAALGYENVASAEAHAEAEVQTKTATNATRAVLVAEGDGIALATRLRQRCDNVVATVRELADKIVHSVTAHYRVAASRAEAKAEAKANAYRATARAAEKAAAEAGEIADLF